jgi:hypothetical protein
MLDGGQYLKKRKDSIIGKIECQVFRASHLSEFKSICRFQTRHKTSHQALNLIPEKNLKT